MASGCVTLKGFFIYLLIDLIFIVTFVLQNKTYVK